MKGRLLFLFLITIISPVLRAQTMPAETPAENSIRQRLPTQVGNYMVGANLFFANVTFQEGTNSIYNVGLNPRAGFFVLPNIALGASLNIGVQGVKNFRAVSYGATPFARVYFAHDNEAKPARPLQFFIEGGIGFSGSVAYYKSSNNGVITTEKEHNNGLQAYLLPGVDYFVNKHVAVEAGLEYSYNSGRAKINTLGLNLGFQIFLGR